MVLTYRYRIKDATAGQHLVQQARAVNRVWNYCGEIQEASRRHNKHWPSGFDLIKLTLGSSKLLGLHSDTVQAVCKQFALSRDAYRKRPRWRGRKSLGWVPFQAARAIRMEGEAVIFLGRARGGPKGREDLVVRDWICGGCGAWHDRDINSAINILVSGRNVGLRVTEIPSL
ncbi:MAG: hypothetical protein ACREFV_09030 [Acetobacteraceae bacterium]